MNAMKTVFFMVALTGLLLLIGGSLGGQTGLVFALILSLAMNLGSYWFSDKIVLKMYRAQEVGPSDHPELYQMVQGLARNAHLPMPKVYLVPDHAPNAFATGRNPDHSAVAVTAGLMNLLNRSELEGVIAHELAHIKNRDTLISCVVAAIAGAVMMIANMAQFAAIFGLGGSRNDEDGPNPIALLLTALIAPLAATMIQMAISRSREFMADSTGAKIAGQKEGLMNALYKIHSAASQVPMQFATESTSHLMIANPFSGQKISNLFSTHPQLEQRIENLRNTRLY